jgi:hypothetical protein
MGKENGMNPERQEKKSFCREHKITGKRYRALLKIQRRKLIAAAKQEAEEQAQGIGA